MGLNFRKSITVGKFFRINLSKSGVSYSVGIPGYRKTVTSKGDLRTTVSIPGTGISHTTTQKPPATIGIAQDNYPKVPSIWTDDLSVMDEILYIPEYPFTTKKKKAEAEMMAPQFLKIAYDCVQLVNETTTPDVFFSRYDLLINVLRKLTSLKNYIKYSGTDPGETLVEIVNNRDNYAELFVLRTIQQEIESASSLKTESGKKNRIIKLVDALEKYPLPDSIKSKLPEMREEALQILTQ